MSGVVLIDGYIEFAVGELERLLRRGGIEVELTPDTIVEAKTVYTKPDDVKCRNVGGHDMTSQQYVCVKRGRKYLHVYYRTPYMYDASRNRIYFYYFRVRV